MTILRRAFALTFALGLAGAGCSPAAPPPAPSPRAASKPAAPPPPSAAPSAAAEDSAPPSVPARRIALDGRGGCAVLEDGGVSCWGGALGDAARRLPEISNAVDVSLGGIVTVIRADGTAVAFPDRDARSKGVTLSLTGVRSIRQGGGAACVLREGGKVACWPRGLLDARTGSENKAIEARAVSDAVAVGAAEGRACALQKDGHVSCWSVGPFAVGEPEVVPGLESAVELHVGPIFACARDAKRKVLCFTHNPHPKPPVAIGEADVMGFVQYNGHHLLLCLAGEKGISCQRPEGFYGLQGDMPLPTGEVPESAGLKVIQLAIVHHAACALLEGGAVRCWGDNYNGVLAQPDPRFIRTPTVVPDLPKIRAVAAGESFSCALSAAAEVYCWGGTIPLGRVHKIPGLSGTLRLMASGGKACAFTAAGEATCFNGTPWRDEGYKLERLAVLDGARQVIMPPTIGADMVVVIGRSGELMIGSSRTFRKGLTTVPRAGPFRRIGVDREGLVLAQDEKGHVFSVWAPGGEPKKPAPQPDLDGALGLNNQGFALLPGGQVRTAAAHGKESSNILPSSPFVSLIDGFKLCGNTAAGGFGCMVDGKLEVGFESAKVVVGVANGHQCSLDDEGVVRCRGKNDDGQCGSGRRSHQLQRAGQGDPALINRGARRPGAGRSVKAR